MQEGEGAIVERGAFDEGQNSVGSVERTESVCASDTGSQSNAKGDSNGGSHTRNYYFSPMTVIVSRIQKMIDQRYFTEGGSRASGEETILEPENDEAIILKEFFIVGLRMPLH
jgi:hypothetical protein